MKPEEFSHPGQGRTRVVQRRRRRRKRRMTEREEEDAEDNVNERT